MLEAKTTTMCSFPTKLRYGFYSSWPRICFVLGFSESLKTKEAAEIWEHELKAGSCLLFAMWPKVI